MTGRPRDAKKEWIRAKAGTHSLAWIETISPVPFNVTVGDRCVVRLMLHGADCYCIVDRIEPGANPHERPIYFLSRH